MATPVNAHSSSPLSTPSPVCHDNVNSLTNSDRPFIVGTFNTGGAISLDILKLMVDKWISPQPLVIGLTEFRLPHNACQWYANRVIRCTSSGEYHLVVSASGSKAGGGFLVSTQLFLAAPPKVKVVVPGRIAEFKS